MNQMINTIIEKNITDYITKISRKYNLDTEELTNIWDEMQNKESKKVRSKSKDDSKDDSSADESDSSENKKSKTKKVVSNKEKPEKIVCSYIFTKGNRLNETCGCKTKDDSLFCTKHKKYEDLETKKTKPIIPTNTKNLILRKNKKIGKMMHKETNMVFNDEKIVIGKCIDDTIHKLIEEDIEICKKFSFKYEENYQNYEEVEISDVSSEDENEESKNVKKSVLKSVNSTRDQLEDVVDILNELQIGDEEDDDEELEEE